MALAVVGVGCSDEPEPSAAAFCERLGELADLDDRVATDPGALRDDVDQLADAAEVAPPEIADDVAVLVGALEQLAAAADANPEDPDAGVDEALVALQGDIEALEAASAEVEAYAASMCALSLGTSGTTRAPGTTGAPGTTSTPSAPTPPPGGDATG